MRVPLLLLAVLLQACAAGRPPSATEVELSRLVSNASAGKAHLVTHFDGPSRLTGVVVQGNDAGAGELVGWVTADRRHLLVGSLFEENSHDLSAEAYAQHVTAHRVPGEEFLQQVRQAPAVTQFPSGTRTLFVFLDADCVFCWGLYQEVSRLSEQFGQASVRVRWIIVGAQSAQSAARGAAILQQGIGGLIANESRYDSTANRGGIDAVDDAEALSKIDANTRLLLRSPAASIATPTLVWRSVRGVESSVGLPEEPVLRALLEEIVPDAQQ